jgi:SAM-dependent methyltransferase
MDDPRQRYRALSAESLAVDDPTGWFDRLYAEAESGRARVPWDRSAPHPLLAAWAQSSAGAGAGVGKRALVVGCGPGDDAELVARLGFDTVAFDVSEAAIRTARQRYPHSPVEYVVADLFDPPAAWERAFDLVVEVFTVQALPFEHHRRAIEQIARFAGGELLVISIARDDGEELTEIPPWPLTRAEIDLFVTAGDLVPVSVERVDDSLWRAEFTRLP